MAPLYIPPKKLTFRLRGRQNQEYFYSRPNNEPTFFHYGDGPYADQ